MTILILPKKPIIRRKQLVGPVRLNTLNSRSKGLIFAYAHNDNPFAANWFGQNKILPVTKFVTSVPGMGTPYGKALDFTTNNGAVTKAVVFGSNARRVLLGSENEFSVGFWAKWTTADGVNRFNALIQKGVDDGSSGSFDWVIGGSRYSFSAARAVWSISTTSDFATNTNVSLNKWYRCVLIKSGSNAEWWLNGVQDATTTTFPAATGDTSGRNFHFGKDFTDSKNSFFGNAVGVMIWNRALSYQEIRDDYFDTYAPFTSVTPNTYNFGSTFGITNVDLDNAIYFNQSNVEINGTGFGSTTGLVTIGGVNQTVTSWTDTKITIGTPNYGGLSAGTNTVKVLKPR